VKVYLVQVQQEIERLGNLVASLSGIASEVAELSEDDQAGDAAQKSDHD
jgi:hypothetical protein